MSCRTQSRYVTEGANWNGARVMDHEAQGIRMRGDNPVKDLPEAEMIHTEAANCPALLRR
eukprot:8781595-Alexandrium_andersonii.AAC.1